MALDRQELNKLARLGAQARLAELEGERQSILRAFPGLGGGGARRGRPPKAASAPAAPTGGKRRGRRRAMSPAEKRAVSLRMKKYWAEQRKAKAKGA